MLPRSTHDFLAPTTRWRDNLCKPRKGKGWVTQRNDTELQNRVSRFRLVRFKVGTGSSRPPSTCNLMNPSATVSVHSRRFSGRSAQFIISNKHPDLSLSEHYHASIFSKLPEHRKFEY